MTGPPTCLVDIPSATSCLPPDLASNMVAMQRTHSDLVKFKRQDPEYPAVLGCFENILANLSNEGSFENASTYNIMVINQCRDGAIFQSAI